MSNNRLLTYGEDDDDLLGEKIQKTKSSQDQGKYEKTSKSQRGSEKFPARGTATKSNKERSNVSNKIQPSFSLNDAEFQKQQGKRTKTLLKREMTQESSIMEMSIIYEKKRSQSHFSQKFIPNQIIDQEEQVNQTSIANPIVNEQEKINNEIGKQVVREMRQQNRSNIYELDDQSYSELIKENNIATMFKPDNEENLNHSDQISAHSNKIKFIQKYGITMNIPSLQVKDTIFFEEDSQYCFQICSYNIENKQKPVVPQNANIAQNKKEDKQVKNQLIQPFLRSRLSRGSIFEHKKYMPQIQVIEEDQEPQKYLQVDKTKKGNTKKVRNQPQNRSKSCENTKGKIREMVSYGVQILDHCQQTKQNQSAIQMPNLQQSSEENLTIVPDHQAEARALKQIEYRFKMQTVSKVYEMHEGMMLRLLNIKDQQSTKILHQVPIHSDLEDLKEVNIKISNDSRNMAIVYNQKYLKIFEIDEKQEKQTNEKRLIKFMDKIKDGNSINVKHTIIKEKDEEIIELSILGGDCKKMMVATDKKVHIFNYGNKNIDNTLEYIGQIVITDQKYKTLCNARIEDNNNGNYKLYLAYKHYGKKVISIFEHPQNEKDEKESFQMTYVREIENKPPIIKISKNMKNVILVNHGENYMLKINKDKKTSVMRKLKINRGEQNLVQYVFADNDEDFFLFISDEYDKTFSMKHTKNENFKLSFDCNIEPGKQSIKVSNMIISKDQEKQKQDEKYYFKIALLQDGGFFIGTSKFAYKKQNEVDTSLEIEEKNEQLIRCYAKNCDHNKLYFKQEETLQFQYDFMQAFSSKWPYITYADIVPGYLIIINMFDSDIIHRVKIPGNPRSILKTFITNTNDLFFVVLNINHEAHENHYEHEKLDQETVSHILYSINLDFGNRRENQNLINVETFDGYIIKELFQYSEKDLIEASELANQKKEWKKKTDQIKLLDIFCRGSSVKENVDINEKTMIFFLIKGAVFKWSELNPKKIEFQFKTQATKFVFVNNNKFSLLHNFKNEENILIKQKIIMIDFDFSTVKEKVIYETTNVGEENIIDFNYDSEQNKLLICLKLISEQNKNRILIYDMQKSSEQSQVLDFCLLENEFEELYGRLQIGNYKFLGGHIYYGNSVIKIRYDLMQSVQSINYMANELFDIYKNIFDLNDNSQMLINGPFVSYSMNKLIYIIKNPEENTCSKLLILPYLHSNKMKMIRNKKNTRYFYTTIPRETQFNKYTEKFIGKKRSIVTNNLDESKFYVYSNKGILRNRIDYNKLTDYYGQIESISPDGLKYVFKKCNGQGIHFIQIFQLTEQSFQPTFREKMNLNSAITKVFDEANKIKFFEQISESNLWIKSFMEKNYIDSKFKIDLEKLKIFINNRGDILLYLVPNFQNMITKNLKKYMNSKVKDEKNKEINWNQKFDNMSIFIQNPEDKKWNPKNSIIIVQNQTESLLVHVNRVSISCRLAVKNSDHNLNKMILNDAYAIFWDNENIHAIGIKEHNHSQKKVLKNCNNNREIHDIRVGSNPNYIAIIASNHSYDTVIIWDILNDNEKEIIDVEGPYEIMWDEFGDVSIVQNHQVIMNQVVKFKKIMPFNDWDIQHEKDTRVLKYTVNCFEQLSKNDVLLNQTNLNKYKGVVVDGINHDSILFKGDICLGSNFMTFVIKNKIEKKCAREVLNNAFDITPYNYIFNNSTAFIDSKFAANNPHDLEDVLKQIEQLDLKYLQQLNFIRVDRDDEDNEKEFGKSQRHIISLLHIALGLEDSKENYQKEDKQNKQKSPIEKKDKEDGTSMDLEIVLQYMAKNKVNINNFIEILNQLVKFSGFCSFFDMVQKDSKEFQQIDAINSLVFSNKEKNIVKQEHYEGLFQEEKCFQQSLNHEQKIISTIQKQLDNSIMSFPVKIQMLNVHWLLNAQDYDDGKNDGLDFLKALRSSKNTQIYESQAIISLIEYLYQEFKSPYIKILMILNIAELIFFIWSMIVHEQMFYPNHTNDYPSREMALFLISMNYILIIIQLFEYLILVIYDPYIIKEFKEFITDSKALLNLIYGILNLILTTFQFRHHQYDWINAGAVFYQRMLQSVLIFVIALKMAKYMQMFDFFHSSINSIFFVYNYQFAIFLGMLISTIMVFSTAFWLLGTQMVQYFQHPSDVHPYVKFTNSMWFNIMIMVNPDTDFFSSPRYYNGVENYYVIQVWTMITSIFILGVFFIVILVLNVLIAVVNDAYVDNKAEKIMQQTKSQLAFIVHRWSLRREACQPTSIEKIHYIITAFYQDKNESEHMMGTLQSINQDGQFMMQQINLIKKEQAKMDMKLQQLINLQTKPQ